MNVDGFVECMNEKWSRNGNVSMHHLIASHHKRDCAGANKLHLNFVHGELILIGSNISFCACSDSIVICHFHFHFDRHFTHRQTTVTLLVLLTANYG